MANSSLATYTNITSNHSGARTQKISKITPHYMAAYWTGKQCADYFKATTRQASSNYCVGVNGDIAVSVPENYRAWTSSSEWNDQRSVTIECGNNSDSSLPDACYKSLIALCADICKRNGITPHYDGTINGTITMHKQFASTSCPGSWLENKITSGQFEKDIKAKMGTATTTTTTTTTTSTVTSVSNKLVKVTYTGSEGLAYHNKASWDDSTIKGYAKAGDVFTVVGEVTVDGYKMLKLKSGYYLTASSTYVKYPYTSTATSKKSNDTIAQEVINGLWGNGKDRVSKLKAAGYDPSVIQALVNKKLGY